MFTLRTKKPGAGNLCYIRKASGGWSGCIKGSPTDSQCDVLANCVGYAIGRFCEIYNELTGYRGNKFNGLNSNAENFIETAKRLGLEIGDVPKPGAILCMRKGQAGNSSDGAGHVIIVEKVNADGTIYTSESGYGGSAFWNQTRSNANGRWGMSSSYAYRGFIYNPAVNDEPEPKPEPTPSDKFNIGDKVVIDGPLYVSSNAANPAGNVSNKVTNITRKAVGSANPYNTTGDLGWMKEANIKAYEDPKPEPTPTPTELNVGDKVKINIKSSGYCASADGTARGGKTYTAANGWVRYILAIHNGKPFPYQVGLGNVTTGFFKEEDLEKM